MAATRQRTPMSLRCRIGWHSMRRVALQRNLMSPSRRERHTSIATYECWRCPHTKTVETFHSWSYWRDFERELEDERLERVIRKATRR